MKTTHGIKGKYTCINIINKLLEYMSLTPNPSALIFTEEELIANYQFPSEAEYRKTQLEWI